MRVAEVQLATRERSGGPGGLIRSPASGHPRPPSPYLRGYSNVGSLLLLPGRRQGQRWLSDAVGAASKFHRCGKWPAARQHQGANDAVTVGGTGPCPDVRI